MQNPRSTKRAKELARQDRQKQKEVKREQRRKEKVDHPTNRVGEDPDIAGIIPGPQPILEE